VGKQAVALGGGDDLDGWNEREVGDGAIAGDEEDQVAAGRNLAADTLQVVAGAVHEVVAAGGHGLRIVEHSIEPYVWVLLHGGADGLKHDVVEAAIFVAAGRVALGRMAVPGGALLEAGDGRQELARRGGVCHTL